MRVALMGIVHESNGFVQTKTTLEDFRAGHWFTGETILDEYRNAHHEVGGMISEMEAAGVTLIPLMYAEATPAGPLTSDTYKTLLTQLLTHLQNVLPVDGCLVVPHGAGMADGQPDMDGHWLSAVREMVGAKIPVIGTIDPHANLSPAMAAATNALVAYKTNPHIDQRETGKLAARILLNTLGGKIKPVQRLKQLPLAISIEQQYTGQEPCKSLFAEALQAIDGEKIVSASVVLGFPYADTKKMGSSLLVVSNDDARAADDLLCRLEQYIAERITAFDGSKKDITACIPALPSAEPPVLLLDMGDNIGGGAPGNSTHILTALEKAGLESTACYLYDPAAVEMLQKMATGEKCFLELGKDPATSQAFQTMVTILGQSDGKFIEQKPRHGGQTHFDMGKSILVVTENGSTLLLSSKRVAPFSLAQWTHMQVDLTTFRYIIAKGVNAPIAAYAPICKTILQVDSPGVTQANMTRFFYQNRRKPMFPFEIP